MVSTVSPKAIYNFLAGGKRDDLVVDYGVN